MIPQPTNYRGPTEGGLSMISINGLTHPTCYLLSPPLKIHTSTYCLLKKADSPAVYVLEVV